MFFYQYVLGVSETHFSPCPVVPAQMSSEKGPSIFMDKNIITSIIIIIIIFEGEKKKA